MEYRTLGRTRLEVSPIALGTVELGLDYGIEVKGEYGIPSEMASISLVHAALEAGINFIDTARLYGDSERVLGLALKDRRERVVLATKVDPRSPKDATWTDTETRHVMAESLQTSLSLLQTDHVDIWMVHSVDRSLFAQIDSVLEEFHAAKHRGQIGWTGASFYGVDLPIVALQEDLFDVIQVTYSVLDQRICQSVLSLARDHNVGVVARSVLLKGALTARAEYLPERLAQLRDHSRQFRKIIASLDGTTTPAQGAIAYALAQPQIDSVLIGARSLDELREDLGALKINFPSPALQQLDALAIEDEALLDPSTWGIP